MNTVGIMLLGAFICMGSTIALYVINVINLKDKLIPTSLLKQSCLLSNVVLTIILVSSLVFSVSGCFKVIKERIDYAEFYNSVCLTTEEMERK
jgi:hypothetical protein